MKQYRISQYGEFWYLEVRKRAFGFLWSYWSTVDYSRSEKYVLDIYNNLKQN